MRSIRWGVAATVAAACLSMLCAAPRAHAQTYSFSLLYTFRLGVETLAPGPFGGLVRDAQGNLSGTTYGGGAFGGGTAYRLSPSGEFTVLHNFGGGTDGAGPYAGLTPDGEGEFYGTTSGGGLADCTGGCGTVFKVDASGNENVVFRFSNGTTGYEPIAGVVLDSSGNLYGSTWLSDGGCGAVFKLSQTGEETVLHSFPCNGTGDGSGPAGGVIRDSKGNLYGTTTGGGAFGWGTVYKVSAEGTETVLYSFTGKADGGGPQSALIEDAEGNLYGTTESGGITGVDTVCGNPPGCGVVFKVNGAGKESVLFTFNGSDGANPFGPLMRDSAGNFYGTTAYSGGSEIGGGLVFKLTPAGEETVLYTFTAPSEPGTGMGGANPHAGLIEDSAGNLYGTTAYGGFYYCGQDGEGGGCGVVFKLTP